MDAGLREESILKIYRSLYINSENFHNTLREIASHATKNKGSIVANIWNVYQMLLEEVQPAHYELVTKSHKTEVTKDL